QPARGAGGFGLGCAHLEGVRVQSMVGQAFQPASVGQAFQPATLKKQAGWKACPTTGHAPMSTPIDHPQMPPAGGLALTLGPDVAQAGPEAARQAQQAAAGAGSSGPPHFEFAGEAVQAGIDVGGVVLDAAADVGGDVLGGALEAVGSGAEVLG